VADCIAADELLDRLVTAEILHGDKGYDSNAVRRKIESKGAAPNIPPKSNRRWKNCFSPWLYRHRNAIERMFGRLKDFRRIATRYDRLARNFLTAVCLEVSLNLGDGLRGQAAAVWDCEDAWLPATSIPSANLAP
jgi:transposase